MALTINCEIQTMWRPRLRVADFVYFSNRYGGLWNVLLNIATFAHYRDSQASIVPLPQICWSPDRVRH